LMKPAEFSMSLESSIKCNNYSLYVELCIFR
jgi:hypothetical protein